MNVSWSEYLPSNSIFQLLPNSDNKDKLIPKTLSPSFLIVSRLPLKILVSNLVFSYSFLKFNWSALPLFPF